MPTFSLVCFPTTRIPLTPSVTRWCHVCSAEVWVSHIMLHRVDTNEAQPTCMDCAEGLMNQQQPRVIVHPDQVQALRSEGLLDYAREFVKRKNSRRFR